MTHQPPPTPSWSWASPPHHPYVPPAARTARASPAARPPGPATSVLTHTATGLVCLVIGVALAGGSAAPGAAAPSPGAAGARPALPPPAAAAPFSGPVDFFGPGTYLVGEDIEAGEYRTGGAAPGDLVSMCHWSRNADASGEFASILASDAFEGPGRVTVSDGEYFQTSGCVWQAA